MNCEKHLLKKKRALIPLDVIREGCIRFCKASGGDQQMHFKMLFLISDGHNCISSLWTNTFIPGGKKHGGGHLKDLLKATEDVAQ